MKSICLYQSWPLLKSENKTHTLCDTKAWSKFSWLAPFLPLALSPLVKATLPKWSGGVTSLMAPPWEFWYNTPENILSHWIEDQQAVLSPTCLFHSYSTLYLTVCFSSKHPTNSQIKTLRRPYFFSRPCLYSELFPFYIWGGECADNHPSPQTNIGLLYSLMESFEFIF